MTKEQDSRFKKTKEGNIEAVQIYKGTPVVLNIDGQEVEIGKQEDYEVTQIIFKEKIPSLIKYLTYQLTGVNQKIKAADDVINTHKAIDLEVIKEAVMKIPKDKINAKMQGLNRLTEGFYMKSGAIDNKAVLEKNKEKIVEQLEFLKKSI